MCFSWSCGGVKSNELVLRKNQRDGKLRQFREKLLPQRAQKWGHNYSGKEHQGHFYEMRDHAADLCADQNDLDEERKTGEVGQIEDNFQKNTFEEIRGMLEMGHF